MSSGRRPEELGLAKAQRLEEAVELGAEIARALVQGDPHEGADDTETAAFLRRAVEGFTIHLFSRGFADEDIRGAQRRVVAAARAAYIERWLESAADDEEFYADGKYDEVSERALAEETWSDRFRTLQSWW